MAPRAEDLADGELPVIEPYAVLDITKTATADEIKSAYRKAALKHHPDKAPEHLKATAHTKFQDIAFAYAVLSDPVRRKRYDVTGSTSESIDLDDFNFTEFCREQLRDVVSSEAIEKLAKEYKGSLEEKDDLLNAYRQSMGRWGGIYERVMLSDPLEDEDRFRAIFDDSIKSGEIKAYKAYTNDTQEAKDARMRKARSEAEEAMEHAKELGIADKLFGNGKAKKDGGHDALAALIQTKQRPRKSFFDYLEAKYTSNDKKPKGKKSKKRASDDEEDEDEDGMPSEEAFQKAAERLRKGKPVGGDEAADGRKSKRAKR